MFILINNMVGSHCCEVYTWKLRGPYKVCHGHMNVLMKVFFSKKHDGYFNQQLSALWWVATAVGKYMAWGLEVPI